MSKLNNGYWIGATDKSQEGHFKWETTQKSLTFKNFAHGEPNNIGDEDCLVVRSDGKWNDIPCDANAMIVCQFP